MVDPRVVPLSVDGSTDLSQRTVGDLVVLPVGVVNERIRSPEPETKEKVLSQSKPHWTCMENCLKDISCILQPGPCFIIS